MAIKPASAEQLEKVQELLRAEARPPDVEARNVAVATNLNEDSYLSFRGRLYRVAPVPWRAGLELQEIYLEIERFAKLDESEESLQQMLACFTRAIPLFHRLVKPVSWLVRPFWRWMKNPFEDVSQQEIGELLAFFSSCRTKSRVRLLGGLAYRPSLSTLTASTSSPTTPRLTVISGDG